MTITKSDAIAIRSEHDIVLARQNVRRVAQDIGLGIVDQTKIVTAASELARNAVVHGRGGTVELERVEADGRRGLRLTFTDHGPGIPDIETAMKDGFTTGGGLGLGLGGAKRLVNEFEIRSQPGAGTVVRVTRWA
jgi:serine/threonine-protein kinase RsbT